MPTLTLVQAQGLAAGTLTRCRTDIEMREASPVR